MAKIRVPSLQHLAKNWRPTATAVERRLIALARNPPNFSYSPLEAAVRDMLVFQQPYDDIRRGIIAKVARTGVRNNFLGVLPLLRDYFEHVSPDFVQEVSPRYYPVARDLHVPFRPPLIYGLNGELCIPWISYWRSDPLDTDRLSLFATVVKSLLAEDPDLDSIRLTILDLSAPTPRQERVLKTIELDSIPTVHQDRMVEMLGIYVEGYRRANAYLDSHDTVQPGRQETRDTEEVQHNPQLELLDDQ